MEYVKIIDAVATPYSRSNLQSDHPQISFPLILTPEILAEYGMIEYIKSDRPEYDYRTHVPVEREPVLLDGKYVQTWELTPLSEEQIAILQSQEIARRRQNPETIRTLLEALGRIVTRGMILQNDLTPGEVDLLADLYPAISPSMAGVMLDVDEIYNYEGVLYKVVQAHTVQADWMPPLVPALFAPVVAPGIIPEWIQPAGAHNAYAIGAQVTHNGRLWESAVSSNVWTPGEYGWTDLGPV